MTDLDQTTDDFAPNGTAENATDEHGRDHAQDGGATGRRMLIRRLALGSVGAAAGAVALGQHAAAGDSESATDIGGNALELGDDVINSTASATTVQYAGADELTESSVLNVGLDGPNGTDGNNVFPGALGGYGKGVVPNGVHGSTLSTGGAGVVAAHLAPPQGATADPQQAAATGLIVASAGGPQIKFVGLPGAVVGPTTGVHSPGELYVDADGTLWFTVPVPTTDDGGGDGAGGGDATGALVVGDVRFVKLAGTPTAGQFHALPVAQRIFDSREGDDPTKLAKSDTADIDLTKTSTGDDSGFPAGASAALVNITLDLTENAGFAKIVATGTDPTTVNTSNINWYESNQITANQATVAVSASGGATVQVDGDAGGRTHIIIDLQGYYL